MSRIYRFIGVTEDFTSDILDHQINAAAKQKLVARSQPLYWAAKALRRVGFQQAAERVERSNVARIPPMSGETRQRLIETYRDKNAELAELIGRNLDHWNA